MFEQQQQSIYDKADRIMAELSEMVSHSILDALSEKESDANGEVDEEELRKQEALWDRAEGQIDEALKTVLEIKDPLELQGI